MSDSIDGQTDFIPTPFLRLWIPGKPIAQGSKKHVGNGVMVESAKGLKPWRATVAAAASEVWGERDLLDEPLDLTLRFHFARAKNHYRTGRHSNLLKDSAPHWHTKTPDGDKLERAINDALTGVVWRDDSIVCVVNKSKAYTSGSEGVEIVIRPAPAR